MKNRNLFILMAAVMPLISCGTVGHSAFYGGSQFRNSIYYTPSNQEYAQVQEQPGNVQEVVQNSTSGEVQQYQYDASANTKTVHVGEANEVNINYEPGVTYVIADDDESYQARLRKFDSPTYNINIDFVEPSYWWDIRFGWYRPYGVAWRSAWYSPWWDRYYSWYGPSLYYWHDPWYTGPYWAWYNPWIDPWWGPVHRPGHHHPPHWPGYGPGPGHGHGHHGRDVYYGKRSSGSTYRDMDRGSVATGNHNNVQGRPNTGSVTRRPSVGTAPGNANKGSAVVKGSSQQKEQQYRRVTRSRSSGETKVKSSNGSSNRNSNYNYNRSNSSNSYNRSGSSYSNSSGSTSYGNSGGGSRSQGGGSSYRRR